MKIGFNVDGSIQFLDLGEELRSLLLLLLLLLKNFYFSKVVKAFNRELNIIINMTIFYLTYHRDKLYVISIPKTNERIVNKKCFNLYGDFILGITDEYLENKLLKRTQGNLIYNMDSENNIISATP